MPIPAGAPLLTQSDQVSLSIFVTQAGDLGQAACQPQYPCPPGHGNLHNARQSARTLSYQLLKVIDAAVPVINRQISGMEFMKDMKQFFKLYDI